jgi:hypothetical protein
MAGMPLGDGDDFVGWIKDAVMDGPSGEARVVAGLPVMDAAQAHIAVAALGDAQGDRGIPTLRQVLAGRAVQVDLRCGALLALAKRAGADASDLFAIHLDHGDESIRFYAMHCLAVVGDDRAWPAAFAELTRILERPPPSVRPPMNSFHAAFASSVAVTYLIRHLRGHPNRKRELVAGLRASFDRLYPSERDFLAVHWPGCQPGGPDADDLPEPDPRPFVDWARDPLFGPLY